MYIVGLGATPPTEPTLPERVARVIVGMDQEATAERNEAMGIWDR
jgi:hypothetical protein